MNKKTLKIAIALPKKKRLIFSVALLSMLLVAVAYAAFISLWQRNPTILVQYKYYSATLCDPNNRAGIVMRQSVNAWSIQPTNDHVWELALVIDAMNQIDTGVIVINATIPSTLSMNISSVDIYYMQYVSGVVYDIPVLVRNLATNVVLGTEISLIKTEVLAGSRPHDPAQIVFLLLSLREYQTAPTNETTVLVPTTVELGVSTF